MGFGGVVVMVGVYMPRVADRGSVYLCRVVDVSL